VITLLAACLLACSDSTSPVDDPKPTEVELPTINVPVLVASNDRIYTLRAVDDTSRALDARRTDGKILWTVSVPICGLAADSCFMATDGSGNVYLNTSRGLMSRGRSNGALRWTAASIIREASAAVSTSGRIFVADRDVSPALMYAVDASAGTTSWSTILPPNLNVSATLLDESRSTVYAIGRGSAIALDMQTGSIKWITSQNCFGGSVGSLAADGTIYVTCDSDFSSRLFAYSPAGTLQWQVSLGSTNGTLAPLIDAAGTIYVANGGSVTALNKDGTTAWRMAGLFRNQTHPVIDSNKNVFVVASRISSISGRYLFAINNGQVVETKGLFPCIGALLLNDSGRLYCAEVGLLIYAGTAGYDAAAQWSQIGHDSNRSARR
jgi:outer membrane protein assembly factor BamB